MSALSATIFFAHFSMSTYPSVLLSPVHGLHIVCMFDNWTDNKYFNCITFFTALAPLPDFRIWLRYKRSPADLLQRLSGTVRCLTVHDRTSADVTIYSSQSAPVRYATTQDHILKNSLPPGRLSSSSVMCKSLKSYDISFIYEHFKYAVY